MTVCLIHATVALHHKSLLHNVPHIQRTALPTYTGLTRASKSRSSLHLAPLEPLHEAETGARFYDSGDSGVEAAGYEWSPLGAAQVRLPFIA